MSTLKNKASVGRSGAIGSRRPPSARSRRLSASKSGVVAKIEANTELIQESSEEMSIEASNKTRAFDFEELKNNLKLGEILGRRLSKSSSTDDLPVGEMSRESDSDSGSWRRGTRVRRSLQFGTKEDGSSFTPTIATKRHSFVTVESLRDVRSRLKHCDPLLTNDNDMTQNILLKSDDRINSSSGLVRAIEQGTKMTSSTTTFGSVSGKTDSLESHDWKRAESETNKTVVTLNEQHSESGMVSPTKKRFNESVAFFRGGYNENHKNGSLKNFPARQNLITIPIIFQQEISNEIDKRRFSLRSGRDSETSGEESDSLGWASKRQLDGLAPLKRRSWAGDSTLFNNNRDEEKTMSLTFSSEQEETVQSFGSNHMKKNKRVEFCKTEVHFAAESGKFNIVETDEKPPPSNNFRRRRRSHPVTNNGTDNSSTSNSLQVAQKPPLPELRFGDTTYEKEMLTATSSNDVIAVAQEKSNTSIAVVEKSSESEQPKNSYKRHSVDFSALEEKPRTNSISDATTLVRSTVTLKIQPPEPSKASPSSTLDPEAGTMELQKLIKSLRPTSATRRSLDSTQSLLITEEEPLQFSVAERIKLHEDRKVKGFSTKVNVGGTTVVRNSESIWLAGSREQTNHLDVTSGMYSSLIIFLRHFTVIGRCVDLSTRRTYAKLLNTPYGNVMLLRNILSHFSLPLTCAVLAFFKTKASLQIYASVYLLFCSFVSFIRMQITLIVSCIPVRLWNASLCKSLKSCYVLFSFLPIYLPKSKHTDYSSKNQQTLHVPGLQTRNKSLKITANASPKNCSTKWTAQN